MVLCRNIHVAIMYNPSNNMTDKGFHSKIHILFHHLAHMHSLCDH